MDRAQMRAATWLLPASCLLLLLLLPGGSAANATEPASLSVVSMNAGDRPLYTSLVVHSPGAEGAVAVGSPGELQQTQFWPYSAALEAQAARNTVAAPDSTLQSSLYQEQRQQHPASLQQQLLESQSRQLQLQLKQVQQQLQLHRQEHLQQQPAQQLRASPHQPVDQASPAPLPTTPQQLQQPGLQLQASQQLSGGQASPALLPTTAQQLQVVRQTTPLPQLFHSHAPPEAQLTAASDVVPQEISPSTTPPKTTAAVLSTAGGGLQYTRGDHQRQMQTLYHQMRHMPPEYRQQLHEKQQQRQGQLLQQQQQQQQLMQQQLRQQQQQQRQQQQQKQQQQQQKLLAQQQKQQQQLLLQQQQLKQQQQQQLQAASASHTSVRAVSNPYRWADMGSGVEISSNAIDDGIVVERSTPPPISSLLLTRGQALFFLDDQLHAPAEAAAPTSGRNAFDHAKALGNSDTFDPSDAMPMTTPAATAPSPAPAPSSPAGYPPRGAPYGQQLQKPHSWPRKPPQPAEQQQLQSSNSWPPQPAEQQQLQSSDSWPRQPPASKATEPQPQQQQLQLQNTRGSVPEHPQSQSAGLQLQGQKLQKGRPKQRTNRHRHNKQRPPPADLPSASSESDSDSGKPPHTPVGTAGPASAGVGESSQQLPVAAQLAGPWQQLAAQLGAPAGSFVVQLPLAAGAGPGGGVVPALVVPIPQLRAGSAPPLLFRQQLQLPWAQQLQTTAAAGQQVLPLVSYFPQPASGLYFPSAAPAAQFGNSFRASEQEQPLVSGGPQLTQEWQQHKEQQQEQQRQQQQQQQQQQQRANYSQSTQRIHQLPSQQERPSTALPQPAPPPYSSGSSSSSLQAQTRAPLQANHHHHHQAPQHAPSQPPAYNHRHHQQLVFSPQDHPPVSSILAPAAHAAAYVPAAGTTAATVSPVQASHTYLQLQAVAAAGLQQPGVGAAPQLLHPQSPLHGAAAVSPAAAGQQPYYQTVTPVPVAARPNLHQHGSAILLSHVPGQHEQQQSHVYSGGILLPEVLRNLLFPQTQIQSSASVHGNAHRHHYHQQNPLQYTAGLGSDLLRQQPYRYVHSHGGAAQAADVSTPRPYHQGQVSHVASLGSDILRLHPYQQVSANSAAATRQHPQQSSPLTAGVRPPVHNSAAASSGRVVVSVEPAIVKSLSYTEPADVSDQKSPQQNSATSSPAYHSNGAQHIHMITAVPAQSTVLLPVAPVHHTHPYHSTSHVRPLQPPNNVIHEAQKVVSSNGFRVNHEKQTQAQGYSSAAPVTVIYRSSIGVTSPNQRAPHQNAAGRPQRHNSDLQTPLEVDLRPPPPVMA